MCHTATQLCIQCKAQACCSTHLFITHLWSPLLVLHSFLRRRSFVVPKRLPLPINKEREIDPPLRCLRSFSFFSCSPGGPASRCVLQPLDCWQCRRCTCARTRPRESPVCDAKRRRLPRTAQIHCISCVVTNNPSHWPSHCWWHSHCW